MEKHSCGPQCRVYAGHCTAGTLPADTSSYPGNRELLPASNTDGTKVPGLMQMASDAPFPRAFFIKTNQDTSSKDKSPFSQSLFFFFFLAARYSMWES